MAVAQMPAAGTIERPLPAMVKDAAIVAVMTALLATPMVGFHTVDTQRGTVMHFRFGEMMYAVALIFLGRLGVSLIDAGRGMAVTLAAAALSLAWLIEWVRGGGTFAYPVLGWLTFLVSLALVVRGGIAWGRQRMRGAAEERAQPIDWVLRVTRWIGPLLLIYALALPVLHFDQRSVGLGIQVLIYVMLGWGLNVVVGLAGLLDLGYVAFYAVGAYTYGLLSTKLGIGFWETLPLAGLLAASFGVLLGFPVLRLRGDYLAIVTLGFGEIVRIVLLNWNELSNGPQGVGDIPAPDFFGMPFTPGAPEGVVPFHQFFNIDFSPLHRQVYFYYIILILALLTNWFTLRIRKLPISRAWEALREDETACRALGINPTNTKLTAFSIGAMLAGFAGSFFSARQGYITPASFSFIESAIILAIVVLGGMGSQVGVVVASIILIGGPEWFRELESFRMLGFGGLMVAIMIWRPQGLLAHREPTILLHKSGKT